MLEISMNKLERVQTCERDGKRNKQIAKKKTETDWKWEGKFWERFSSSKVLYRVSRMLDFWFFLMEWKFLKFLTSSNIFSFIHSLFI